MFIRGSTIVAYHRLKLIFDVLWGARRTFTVDLELKTPIADPEARICLLSVRREPAEWVNFFRFGSAYTKIHSAAATLPVLPRLYSRIHATVRSYEPRTR
jgi:hypothetical protein